MGMMRLAIGDAVVTSLWVSSGPPCLSLFTSMIAASVGLPRLLITTLLATFIVPIFVLLGDLMGGASFNPSATATLYAAGLSPPGSTFLSLAARFPAQAAGGALGAKAALLLIPDHYRFLLKGPSLNVGLHAGAAVEGALSFVLNFATLVVVLRGPRNTLIKFLLLAMATVGLASVGSGFTGPSMNPANAFGWAYANDWHNSWEHFYVYWIGPLLGSVLAAKLFCFLLPPPPKEKKA